MIRRYPITSFLIVTLGVVWSALGLPRLAEHFDVISVDLPGHGGSPIGDVWQPTVAALTDAVEADLDARGLGRVHVFGNSLGARIGIELAARRRTLSVVAISPSGLGLPAERVHQGQLHRRPGGAGHE